MAVLDTIITNSSLRDIAGTLGQAPTRSLGFLPLSVNAYQLLRLSLGVFCQKYYVKRRGRLTAAYAAVKETIVFPNESMRLRVVMRVVL